MGQVRPHDQGDRLAVRAVLLGAGYAGNGVVVQYRSQQNGDTSQISGVAGTVPVYAAVYVTPGTA